ncbi:MAG: NAD(P)-dependent alcohol dehydrogenase [Rhodospirillales bacterium]|nr:NAD(P)-dependent alcohol dehydrogenase [Rhodospirillales bacterium]MBN8897977.1 NAD(P)-dependent alcohol dehydrogenase [Rhodospirillales bacterium]
MRVYRFPKAAGIDTLQLADEPTPTPARGQILVRMRAASLNYRDLNVAAGKPARGTIPENLVPLSDGAGEVVAIGPDVTRVAVGDRVAGLFMQTWLGGALEPAHVASSRGGAIDGVLADYVLFDQDGVVPLPDHLSFTEGATLPCAALTAWNALYGGRPLQPGETVLVLGTGGVSIFALQFAHAAGARVIATSSSDQKLARARALGASSGVNYRANPEWQEDVLALTDGRGVDHVVEVGGAGTLPRSIEATRHGGQIHLIGVLTGGEINPTPILRRTLMLRGIYVGSREMFQAMNRAIALHAIRPVIDRVFPFAEARAAYHHMTRQGHLGKIVIEID